MNAAEIIREINSLPEEEKGKVVEFVNQLKDAAESSKQNTAKAQFEQASQEVLTKHAKLFEKLAK